MRFAWNGVNQRGSIPGFDEFTAIYRIVPYTNDEPVQTTIRIRSRGPHDPGDGNYFCSHVTLTGVGYVVGSNLYALSLTSDIKEYSNGQFIYRYSYRQWTPDASVEGECTRRFPGDQWAVTRRNTRRVGPFDGTHTLYQTWVYQGHFDDLVDPYAAIFSNLPLWYVDSPSSPWFDFVEVVGTSWTAGEYAPSLLPDAVDNHTVTNLDAILASAYVAAFDSLPAITCNNIANAIEAVSMIKDIVLDHDLSGLGKLSDAWLGYRYSYSTTKSDLIDLVNYTNRIRDLAGVQHVTGHGVIHPPSNNGSVTVRCSLTMTTDGLSSIYSWAEKYGLALDGYNLWDMIPYSFMVDWLLPIGPMLEAARSADYAARLTPSAVWYSITHEFTNSSGAQQCDYYRFAGGNFLPSRAPSSLIPHLSTNGRTWLKRGADLLCIAK